MVVKRGPLYNAIQNLIVDEKEYAEKIWNETQHKLESTSMDLQTAVNFMKNYEQIMEDKLKQLNEWHQYEALQHCYTQYERQIARFNRDLLYKYRVCRQALNSSMSQLHEEMKTEILYIRDASLEVQELMYDCNITDLRRFDAEDRFTATKVTTCIISQLGHIRQHQFKATHVCMDIIARIAANDMNQNYDGPDEIGNSKPNTDNVCLDFRNLSNEFESIYQRVMTCVENKNEIW